jgi:putative (di)nucleoside polyphosphate hydrolase
LSQVFFKGSIIFCTFDYIAGKKLTPPKFVRTLGFEWLFRLFTQPYRLKRIYNATFGLIKLLVKYKFFKTFPLRPNVAVVIKNSANEILVCQRQPGISKFYSEKSTLKNRFDNYWQFPQGGIDGNEDIVKAAEREALEETGLKNLKFIRLSKKTHAYEWNNAIRKINLNRKLLYRGQLQHVAYFEYSGNFEDVKVDQKEFINFKWLPQAALLNTIHEERAGLTKIVVEDLSLL